MCLSQVVFFFFKKGTFVQCFDSLLALSIIWIFTATKNIDTCAATFLLIAHYQELEPIEDRSIITLTNFGSPQAERHNSQQPKISRQSRKTILKLSGVQTNIFLSHVQKLSLEQRFDAIMVLCLFPQDRQLQANSKRLHIWRGKTPVFTCVTQQEPGRRTLLSGAWCCEGWFEPSTAIHRYPPQSTIHRSVKPVGGASCRPGQVESVC